MPKIFFAIGFFVLVLNVFGTFKSYPDVTNYTGVFIDDSQLNYNQYAEKLDSLNEARLAHVLSDIDFLKQVNIAVQKRFCHKVFEESNDYYGQKIGLEDNWLLWIIQKS